MMKNIEEPLSIDRLEFDKSNPRYAPYHALGNAPTDKDIVSYPFSLDGSGYSLTLKQTYSLGAEAYLFCLIVSNVYGNGLILPEEAIAPSIRAARDLFQICACISAAGICLGHVVSIGYPRPDASNFLTKLQSTHTHLAPTIIVKAAIPPGSPPRVNDGGVDVISWTPEQDGNAGLRYYMGQVASGHNWRDKSVIPEIPSFNALYFDMPPAHPAGQIFIPHCVTGDWDRRNVSFSDMVQMNIQQETHRLGYICYRHRLPKYIDVATTLAQNILAQVERYNERNSIAAWVNEFIARAETEQIFEI